MDLYVRGTGTCLCKKIICTNIIYCLNMWYWYTLFFTDKCLWFVGSRAAAKRVRAFKDGTDCVGWCLCLLCSVFVNCVYNCLFSFYHVLSFRPEFWCRYVTVAVRLNLYPWKFPKLFLEMSTMHVWTCSTNILTSFILRWKIQSKH